MNPIPKLKTYFAKKKSILAAYLFGSQVTGKTTDWSDIDVAILLKEGSKTDPFKIEFQCRYDLEKLLASEVDVAILNTADPFLWQQVYTKGVLIFTRNKKESEALKWRHLKLYWDYIPIKRILEESAIKRLSRHI